MREDQRAAIGEVEQSQNNPCSAADREEAPSGLVNRFGSEAAARRASVHFPPEEDRDVEGYYALFVFDPDGIRIEVFSWPRAGA